MLRKIETPVNNILFTIHGLEVAHQKHVQKTSRIYRAVVSFISFFVGVSVGLLTWQPAAGGLSALACFVAGEAFNPIYQQSNQLSKATKNLEEKLKPSFFKNHSAKKDEIKQQSFSKPVVSFS